MPVRQATIDDAQAIARVHVESWRETYPGIVPQSELDALDIGERAAMWRSILSDPARRELVAVAEEESGMVGFVHGETGAGGSQIRAIYLLRAAQGTGLGRALMAALAERLAGLDAGPVSLEVARDNLGARAFYERLGGQLGAEQACSAALSDVPAVLYRWESPRALLDACRKD